MYHQGDMIVRISVCGNRINLLLTPVRSRRTEMSLCVTTSLVVAFDDTTIASNSLRSFP